MTDPTNRPLWQVMRDAYDDAFPEYDEAADGIAAEIRALVEAKLPEEPWQPAGPCDIAEGFRRDERQRLRLDLLAEADRAEAGE